MKHSLCVKPCVKNLICIYSHASHQYLGANDCYKPPLKIEGQTLWGSFIACLMSQSRKIMVTGFELSLQNSQLLYLRIILLYITMSYLYLAEDREGSGTR